MAHAGHQCGRCGVIADTSLGWGIEEVAAVLISDRRGCGGRYLIYRVCPSQLAKLICESPHPLALRLLSLCTVYLPLSLCTVQLMKLPK